MRLAVSPLRFATARLATGVQVRYVEQGEPGGEPLVLLHGYSDSWYSYSRLLPLLPAQYHTYAFDQRGHGDSERPAAGYTVDDYAADVVAFLDAVGLDAATVVGHSGGSLIAQRVALTAPHRVRRLVLIGSATTLRGNPDVEALGEEVRALEDPVSPEWVREFQASTIYEPVPAPFFERVVSESLKLPARVWRDYWEGVVLPVEHADLLRALDVPTLIIWGEHDALFPWAEQERLQAAIRGARLAVYPRTGHCPQWERPEQVAADLDAFICSRA